MVFLSQVDVTSFVYAQEEVNEATLLQNVERSGVEKDRLAPLIELGEYYTLFHVFKADSIREVLQQRLDFYPANQQFDAKVYIADILLLNGDFNGYFQVVEDLKSFADNTLTRRQLFHKYINIAYIKGAYEQYTSSKILLEKAMNIAQELREYSLLSRSYRAKAYTYMMANEKDSAIYFTDRAIQFARRSGVKRDLAESFNQQATIYDYYGQLELALSKNLVAYQLATSVNDYPQMATYAREIGRKQLMINNLKEADIYFQESFNFSSLVYDNRQKGLAKTFQAEVVRQNGNPAEALRMNDVALKLLDGINDQNGRGTIHNHMGLSYKDLSAYPLAVNQFNQALVYFEKSANKDRIAEVYLNVGMVFQKQGLHRKALSYLKKSIDVQNTFGSRNFINNSYRVMSEVYKELGENKLSLSYLEKYVEAQDNNSILQASKKIAELSELYRSEQRDRLISEQADSLEKQQRENELAETKLENVSLRNNFQTYIIVGFLIIIVLASIIGYNRYQQRIIEQKSRETEMAQTLLRTQMNPHFIFNAMSVIQSYIYDNDVKNSSKFLVSFSRLMRLILENSPKEFIPISVEMDILTKYLETQKLRFEDRFEFELECSEDLLFEKAMIPPMITQPFIENAIEHGQLHTIEGGKIHITFRKEQKMLNILIADNGVGRAAAEKSSKSKDHKSMALKITQQRIENLNYKYKSNGFLTIDDLNPETSTGTKVSISIPYRSEDLEMLNKEFSK